MPKDHASCMRCETLVGQKQQVHRDKRGAQNVSDAKGPRRPLDLRVPRSGRLKAKRSLCSTVGEWPSNPPRGGDGPVW